MNSDSFTKLFSSLITSSIWSEDDKTRIIWITMLAITDMDGFCAASIPGLSAMARVSLADTQAAIAKLESPDGFSRTTTDEGRRIAKVEGGWLLINHAMYRDRERKEKRREYMRDLMAKKRMLAANDANEVITHANSSASVSASSSPSAIPEGGCKGEDGIRGGDNPTSPLAPAKPLPRAKKKTVTVTGPVYTPDFEAFWAEYPKKKAKEYAFGAWLKREDKPPIADILARIELQKQDPGWRKDGGQYIPNPSTWINQARWTDEPTQVPRRKSMLH